MTQNAQKNFITSQNKPKQPKTNQNYSKGAQNQSKSTQNKPKRTETSQSDPEGDLN